jgi:hypothetical protein
VNAIASLASQLAAIPRQPAPPKVQPPHRATSVVVGGRYGHWTVTGYIPGQQLEDGTRSKARCVCRCSCGSMRNVLAQALTSGRSKSCGHGGIGGRPPQEASA